MTARRTYNGRSAPTLRTSNHELQRTAMSDRTVKSDRAYRFAVAPMMEWTDKAEKQSVIST
jgi:hypothetical protein